MCWGWVLPTPGSQILRAKPLPRDFEMQGSFYFCIFLSGSGKCADFCSSCSLIARDKVPGSFSPWSLCAREATECRGQAGGLVSGSREPCSAGWGHLGHGTGGASKCTQEEFLGRGADRPVSMLWTCLEPNFFIFHCLPFKKKPISSPFFHLTSRLQLTELRSGFDFPGLLLISGALSREEEGREQPDFLRAGWSLTWICLPNSVLQQVEWT